MTPKEKAESLIHKYRMLLMDDGEEYGEEILVTKLSIESALITVNEIIETQHLIGKDMNYWLDVRCELNTESLK